MHDENIDSEIPSAERQSFLRLTRELASLPLDKSAAALETSAAIASISLRAGIEFLRAAPAAAEVWKLRSLRSWGELGRRLALGDVETAITFFAAGVAEFEELPQTVHQLVFQLCLRQITLSSQIAIETFRNLPTLAKAINDPETPHGGARSGFGDFAQVGKAQRRVSQSDAGSPRAFAANQRSAVTRKAIELTAEFAARAGGIAADAWTALPPALTNLKSDEALKLLESTADFLERGGGSALQVLDHRWRDIPDLAGNIRRVAEALVDGRQAWQREPGGFRSQQPEVPAGHLRAKLIANVASTSRYASSH